MGNNVSYGPYVQDPDKQASWMKAIGWKTTDQIAEQETSNVNKIVAKAIERALAKG